MGNKLEAQTNRIRAVEEDVSELGEKMVDYDIIVYEQSLEITINRNRVPADKLIITKQRRRHPKNQYKYDKSETLENKATNNSSIPQGKKRNIKSRALITKHSNPQTRNPNPARQALIRKIDPTHLLLISATSCVIILLDDLREINRRKIGCDIELLLGDHPLRVGLIEDSTPNGRAVAAEITCVVLDIVNSLGIRCGNYGLRRSCCRAEATVLERTW